MRTGVRVGVDVGKVRIGVARTDFHGMLATPVETVKRGDGDVARILAIAVELDATEFIVGLPLSLAGTHTASTEDAETFARILATATGIPVRMVDERLSTVSAQAALRSAGRNSKSSRPVIDQVAAVIIVQHALDFERAAGRPPGVLVEADEG
ncbi:putative Holliday junction resolvase [Glaciihabitans tibetensis]|uniref:Putative pre-16S rRNA nuclease n=1 Tax=Glaciihabitans tibetensis TaxID=1266600 RepID=A0A2T0VJI6_9MICO|nr:Holliday junction resolvase RuvX [Glaciihabitans tibetensis]PRY70364.1 putative Holliday junction resolvase [Glaciihabitans tibetensis]